MFVYIYMQCLYFCDKIDQYFQIKEPNIIEAIHAYMAVHYASDLFYRYFTILQSAWYTLIYLLSSFQF